MTIKPENRIPCLDGLRALAIGMVILSHVRYTVAWRAPRILDILWDVMGETGVQVFFGLSGYLITHLLLKEHRRTGTISLRNFYMRRSIRIFPAFYFYLAVILALVSFGILTIPSKLMLAAAAYLKNYFHSSPGDHSWFSGHSWSRAVEEQFYLFGPFLFVVLGLRRAKYAALALILAMPLVRIGTWFLLPESKNFVGGTIHTCADRLMFGCLLALLDGHPAFEALMKRLSSWVFPGIAVIFLVFMGPLLTDCFHNTYRLTAGMSLDCGMIAFIIAWLLRHGESRFALLLNTRPLVHVGVLSYSLYLWQQLFLTGQNHTLTGWFPLNLLFAYGLACFSYYLIEKRFLAMRSRFRNF